MKKNSNPFTYFFDLIPEYEKLGRMSCKPNWDKPREGMIFDEDKSVRWNKEECARLRAKYEEEVKELNTKKNARREELKAYALDLIVKETNCNISNDDARAIWDFCYDNFSGNGWNTFFEKVEETCSLVSTIGRKNKLSK